ncbi:MAG: TetR/AcrR family transcriptional regulator [Alphaproteobacteria bacterium]|nr:TetR/AcrR family transcriptional regulator [Alphaproteobacteria bacterium]
MTQSDDVRDRLAEAVLRLAGERGWQSLTLGDIAEAASLAVGELPAAFRSKTSVLVACAERVESQAAAEPVEFDEADTVRDRLFELLMQRLDLLAPHKAGVGAILRDLPRDPVAGLIAAPQMTRLMAPILRGAGVGTSGPTGLLRCKGLAAVWWRTLSVWTEDDSPDHAKTMAALDQALRRIEPVGQALGRVDACVMPRAAPGGL